MSGWLTFSPRRFHARWFTKMEAVGCGISPLNQFKNRKEGEAVLQHIFKYQWLIGPMNIPRYKWFTLKCNHILQNSETPFRQWYSHLLSPYVKELVEMLLLLRINCPTNCCILSWWLTLSCTHHLGHYIHRQSQLVFLASSDWSIVFILGLLLTRKWATADIPSRDAIQRTYDLPFHTAFLPVSFMGCFPVFRASFWTVAHDWIGRLRILSLHASVGIFPM